MPCCIAKVLNCAFFASFGEFFTEFWCWMIPLVTGTWMHNCSAVVGVLAAWDRMILIFYKETYISKVTHSSSILSVSIVLPHVPPHQTWLTISALLWSRLTRFICLHVVWFLHCPFGTHRSTELESDEKSSSWKGKNYCTCSSAISGEKRWCPWSYPSPIWAARGTSSLSCGILHAFAFHEHWIFPRHSLSCVTTDSVFVWVCFFCRRSSQTERIKYSWTSVSYSGSGAAPSKQKEGFVSRNSKGFHKVLTSVVIPVMESGCSTKSYEKNKI